MNLTDLGFSKGEIMETITSTYKADGKANAAPMGVTMENETTAFLRLFNSTLTLNNLKANKSAVINVTSDIEKFYKTTFKEANPGGLLPQEWFEKAKFVNAPRLRTAEAKIEVTVADLSAIDPQRTLAKCSVKFVEALHLPPRVHSRAFSATIEALIHATRVRIFINDKNKQETVYKLLTLISACKEVVSKTAPSSRYAEIILDLERRIESWKANYESSY